MNAKPSDFQVYTITAATTITATTNDVDAGEMVTRLLRKLSAPT